MKTAAATATPASDLPQLQPFSVLTPIFGVLAGVALLGERVGPLFGLAVALVAAGLWLVNRPDRGGGAAARSA